LITRQIQYYKLSYPSLRSTLFPCTTLFRSRTQQSAAQGITLLEDLDDRVGLDAVALFHGHCLVQFGIEGLAMGVYRHDLMARQLDRKSKRLNSSHVKSSYAVYCLKNNTI